MSDESVSSPAWKRRPQIAGAMMLIKGYAPAVTVCDQCQMPLEREDQTIHVTFVGRAAHYPCPHCHRVSRRTLGRQEQGDART